MKILCFILLLTVLFSCIEIKKDNNKIAELLMEWQYKEIVVPSDMIFIDKYYKEYHATNIFNNEYKILVYIDSTDCLSCELKLQEWSSLVNYINRNSQYKLKTIFIFNFSKNEEMFENVDEVQFPSFYCFDKKDIICKINKFPINKGLDTYLLDVNNQVLLIGNPIKYPDIRELYFDVFNIKQNNILKTEVTYSDNVIDLGDIGVGKDYVLSYSMCNVGENALCINNVQTSCSCIDIDYDNKPVSFNDSITVFFTVKIDNVGFFSKNVLLYTNNNIYPINITLKGMAYYL